MEKQCLECGARFEDNSRSGLKLYCSWNHKKRKNQRDQAKRWRDAGLCRKCGKPTENGRANCPVHLARNLGESKAYYHTHPPKKRPPRSHKVKRLWPMQHDATACPKCQKKAEISLG